MADKHSVYGLAFVADDEPIIFYVGHTNDVERRRSEHKNNPFNENHSEYNTMKYRWCRQLALNDIEYDLFVLNDVLVDDEDSEYAMILEIAEDNRAMGITFYDDLPLTNMKAGDMLTEMLAERVKGAAGVRAFRERRQAAAAATSYQRDNLTPKPSSRAQAMYDWIRAASEARSAATERERYKAAVKADKYKAMLADPDRKQRIEQETERMMNGDQKENPDSLY